jgi:hypothetical protein
MKMAEVFSSTITFSLAVRARQSSLGFIVPPGWMVEGM